MQRVSSSVTSFWTNHSGEIVVAVISVLLTFLLTLVVNPKPLRAAWKHKTQLKNLEEKVIRHDREQTAPAEYIASELRTLLQQVALLVGLIGFHLALSAWIPYGDKLLRSYMGFFLINLAFWSYITSKGLYRFIFPREYRKKLNRKIERLKERGY